MNTAGCIYYCVYTETDFFNSFECCALLQSTACVIGEGHTVILPVVKSILQSLLVHTVFCQFDCLCCTRVHYRERRRISLVLTEIKSQRYDSKTLFYIVILYFQIDL